MDECLKFLKTDYIPNACGSGFLLRPRLSRILLQEEDPSGESYSLQFEVKNTDVLAYWMEKEGQHIQQRLLHKFGEKVVGFTTLMEHIPLEP